MFDAAVLRIGWRRFTLGLAILLQVVCLVIANAVDFERELAALSEGSEHPIKYLAIPRAAERVADSWAQLTGQRQNWALFAPGVNTDPTFPAVEFRWDPGAGGTNDERFRQPAAAIWLSDNEPTNLDRFLRIGGFRLRRLENVITIDTTRPATDMVIALRGHVRQNGDLLFAYLKWRLDAFRRAHPDVSTPRQVILLLRRFHINEPGSRPRWAGPYVQIAARWRPAEAPQPPFLPVEAFNPETHRFEAISR